MFFSRCGRQAAEGEKLRFYPEVKILLSTPEGRDGRFRDRKCGKKFAREKICAKKLDLYKKNKKISK